MKTSSTKDTVETALSWSGAFIVVMLENKVGDFGRDPLHAGAASDEAIALPAFGTGIGHPRFKPAVVAGEPGGQAVFDQPCAATRAFEAVPAIAAQRQRRIAAAVQEHQALFADGDTLRDGGQQRGCNDGFFGLVVYVFFPPAWV